jgi:hypothetical protein
MFHIRFDDEFLASEPEHVVARFRPTILPNRLHKQEKCLWILQQDFKIVLSCGLDKLLR